jgi:hypothetical protein
MGLLSKEAILQADDLPTEDVEVPEWQGTVRVRALTGKERDAFEASLQQQRGKDFVRNTANVRAKLVAKCLIGEDGERLFSENEVNALGAKSAAGLDRVFEVAARLSRLSEEDIDELGKSSDVDPSDDSSSD